jgi:LysM repeat protein
MSRLTRCAVAITMAAAILAPSAAVRAASPSSSTYTVANGDSLGKIASKLGVRLADLLAVNGLTSKSLILPGQQLIVPATLQSYTVKAGDSLNSIASRHQMTLGALLTANGLTADSLITPGMVLKVVGSASGGAGSGSGGSGGSNGGGAPVAPSGQTYTVKAGDSLSAIASRNKVKLAALLSVNNMTAKSLILPGQVLQLPAGAPSAPSAPSTPSTPTTPSGESYTVKPGDSLYAIATRHQVTLAQLLSVNGMTAKSLILPGQTLALPDGAGGGSGSPAPDNSGQIQTVIDYALAQVGKPYKMAAAGPDAFDCSGLTMKAYAQIGISLAHYSAWQANQGAPVAYLSEPIKAGDLIFMSTRGNDIINHVGLAISSTTWVQAPRTGDVVRVGPIPALNKIVAVRRMLP